MDIRALEATARKARAMYNAGTISREEARKMIEPYAEAFNAKSREIAEKYNMRPQKFSFSSFLR